MSRTATDSALRGRLLETARSVPAPDVVLGCSRHGRHTVVSAGGEAGAVHREELRYEIGSATKTYTGLLLAVLVHEGLVRYDDPLDARLPHSARRTQARHAPVPTLLQAVTHTAGLPRLPADLYRHALPRRSTNPYAGYHRQAVLDAYSRVRLRHRPGSRWHYSNLGVAVLGQALGHAAGTGYEDLLTDRVLRPLDLRETALSAAGADTDATGHGSDGTTPVPPADMGGFTAAGAVRATPGDLLRFLDAHLRPQDHPGALGSALHAMRQPVLRRGMGHRHTHTLAWFQHPCDDGGAVCFHAGATAGQEAFLGFRPATGTALVALSTRRHTRRTSLVPAAYALLTGDALASE